MNEVEDVTPDKRIWQMARRIEVMEQEHLETKKKLMAAEAEVIKHAESRRRLHEIGNAMLAAVSRL